MISDIRVVNQSPEDVMSDTERQYLEEEDDEDDDDESGDDEITEEGEEAEFSPSFRGPKDPRSKVLHGRVARLEGLSSRVFWGG